MLYNLGSRSISPRRYRNGGNGGGSGGYRRYSRSRSRSRYFLINSLSSEKTFPLQILNISEIAAVI